MTDFIVFQDINGEQVILRRSCVEQIIDTSFDMQRRKERSIVSREASCTLRLTSGQEIHCGFSWQEALQHLSATHTIVVSTTDVPSDNYGLEIQGNGINVSSFNLMRLLASS